MTVATVQAQSVTRDGMHSAHGVLRIARRARQAAAIAASAGRLREAYARIEALEAQLHRITAEARALADPDVCARLSAAAPALASLCKGQPVDHAARLRRNVAMHAGVVPDHDASLSAWRSAQRGPR